MMHDPEHDAIRALVQAQFDCLNWAPGRDGDWARFSALFVPGAPLYASKRPAQPQTVDAFSARMRGLRASGALATFSEQLGGLRVHRFGRVAVALAACEMRENGTTTTHDVSAFLLVQDTDGWRIAAQAWDIADELPDIAFPGSLL